MDRYADFHRLAFDRPAERVLRITLDSPAKLNAIDREMHGQLERIWSVIDADPEVRCSIITGRGRAFCVGGDASDLTTAESSDPSVEFNGMFRSAAALVMNMVDAKKPIVSAINGPAIGAGLAIALIADVSIAAAEATLFDGHTRMGLAAGDHAAMIWPLLCGVAKTKYFLLANERLTGAEAERHNLIALSVPAEQLEQKSIEIAGRIAQTAPTAVRMTKHVVNHWLRQARPIFELSLALELTNFGGAEAAEAMSAWAEKRPPRFDSDSIF
jgi:enoyl-CoA hydratase